MRRRVGWLLVAVTLSGAVECAEERLPAPSIVVLVSIDTLRADALSCYGNRRETSPQIDALAREGVIFRHAVAPSPWTIPSHASLFTGLDPVVLGGRTDEPLPIGAPTIAEEFGRGGWVTGGLVNSVFLGAKLGFDRGFGEFEHVDEDRKDAPATIDRAIAFLDRNADRRTFLFLHLFDVHGPYTQPAGVPAGVPEGDFVISLLRRIHYHDYLWPPGTPGVPTFERLREDYERGVTRVDAELGRLFDHLRASRRWDDAWIVVTSDHGEAFFEHGVWVGHGLFLYDAELAIPLVIKPPKSWRIERRTSDALTVLTDVAPTLLDAARLPPIPDAQGRSLVPVLRHGGDLPSECAGAVFLASTNTSTRGVRTDRYKYVQPMSLDAEDLVRLHLRPDDDLVPLLAQRIQHGAQLYDLASDPDELDNRIMDEYAIANLLGGCLAERHGQDMLRAAALERGPRDVEFSDEEKETLRSLGYLR